VQLLALEAAWAINGDRPPSVAALLDALEPLAADPSGEVRSEVMCLLGLIAAGLAPDRPERVRAVALLQAGQSDRLSEVRAAARRALPAIEANERGSGTGGPPP
jgi:hypothetical protein